MVKLDGYPENLFKHSYSVGLKMYRYAKERLGYDEDRCVSMFVLGCTHDLGCVFNNRSFDHAYLLGDALLSSYVYSSEIRYHSRYSDYIKVSAEHKLLYFADCTVDEEGNWVTFDERLEDYKNRFGKDSEEYRCAVVLINKLKEWGFTDVTLGGMSDGLFTR